MPSGGEIIHSGFCCNGCFNESFTKYKIMGFLQKALAYSLGRSGIMMCKTFVVSNASIVNLSLHGMGANLHVPLKIAKFIFADIKIFRTFAAEHTETKDENHSQTYRLVRFSDADDAAM